MPAPIDSFIAYQFVTLKKAGFSYQKIADELGWKAKSTAHSVFRRYNKNKSYLPKKSTGRPPMLSEKNQRKLVNDVLKYPETLHFPGLVFQQDNAPTHKASIIKNFFRENEWEVLDWPPYSPDLNIIENLWAIVKKRLAKQRLHGRI